MAPNQFSRNASLLPNNFLSAGNTPISCAIPAMVQPSSSRRAMPVDDSSSSMSSSMASRTRRRSFSTGSAFSSIGFQLPVVHVAIGAGGVGRGRDAAAASVGAEEDANASGCHFLFEHGAILLYGPQFGLLADFLLRALLCQQREQRSHSWIPLRSREFRIGRQTKTAVVADHDGEALATVQQIVVLGRLGRLDSFTSSIGSR